MGVKQTVFFAGLILFLSVSLLPQEPDDARDALGFLSGKYILIGKRIDSRVTYSGEVRFRYLEKTNCLEMTRLIAGKTVKGTARIEPVLGGEAQVLRLAFTEDGVEYQGTFLWRGDLDNFGRLSGYIYVKGTFPKDPGLEAYFIAPGE